MKDNAGGPGVDGEPGGWEVNVHADTCVTPAACERGSGWCP